MTTESAPQSRPLRLFYHPASSASMRVTLYLGCRGVPSSLVELVSTGLATDHRGIMVFTMPEGDPETEKIGTTDLTAFNPEGRIPVLLLPDGRKMTQSGPIIDFVEDCLAGGTGKPMLPEDPWLRAEARRIMWIIASDTQPYQNIPFIIQAMGEWGMVKATPTVHPLRLHFIRREFGALETVMSDCAGKFAVGDEITHADCFLVPQIRNALLAGIDLAREFPTLFRVWESMLAVPEVQAVLEDAGGVVQPLAFDAEKFEVYAAMPKPAKARS
ncbi:MAG: glutathione S-transferase family protein [Methyloligellaceae bacterium]